MQRTLSEEEFFNLCETNLVESRRSYKLNHNKYLCLQKFCIAAAVLSGLTFFIFLDENDSHKAVYGLICFALCILFTFISSKQLVSITFLLETIEYQLEFIYQRKTNATKQ